MEWFEKPLAMSVGDICKEFREAKEPAKQIDVLAQLNDTESTRIAWLLARAGENVPANKLPRAPRSEHGVDLAAVWEGSSEAAEADEVRSRREEKAPEYDGITPIPDPPVRRDPVKKDPVKKDPVDGITADMWRVYLAAVRDCGRAVDERDVREMMTLRGIAERIGGGGDAEMD